MKLADMVTNWKAWGEQDPLWAILTDASKQNNQWDIGEFFATGRAQVDRDMKALRQQDVHIAFGKALDFGCGIGRLTQSLATHFAEVHGVDISPTMIDRARKLGAVRNSPAIFHHNPHVDLRLLGDATFDFIYTFITLQHIPTPFQMSYLSEFCRILRPGGIAYFQAVHAVSWRRFVPSWFVEFYRRQKYAGRPYVPMYGIHPRAVSRLAQDHGASIVSHRCTPDKDSTRFMDDYYVMRKNKIFSGA